ncbi:hypothetical protein BTA51_09060 [Hahella sp. CCB-MM4]|uniref:VOC family protein n=1 Tax=Hahella sp. (strain CCB-MM4) TaxID=1926491 RepID=UPI000B9A49D0|nr:VOC family protein [Hahella sp. CCB-MM4]OZG73921.1 hypothetical protein BTA51_09060 [Hahella sp. CCB-MM4]
MNISHLDHYVLTVMDIDKTVDFYQTVMGMEKEIFGNGRVALKFGHQKINLHTYGTETEPKAGNVQPGSADMCFISAISLEEVMSHLAEHGVEIIDGPVPRTGAMGPITSVYFRDPDLNLLEVSTYDTKRKSL